MFLRVALHKLSEQSENPDLSPIHRGTSATSRRLLSDAAVGGVPTEDVGRGRGPRPLTPELPLAHARSCSA